MKMRMLILLSLLSAPFRETAGQSEATFTFYHGRNKESGPISDDRNAVLASAQRKFDRSYAIGTQVCAVVRNAHPVNYSYSFTQVVDTPKVDMPDFSKFKAFITDLPGVVGDLSQAKKIATSMNIAGAQKDSALKAKIVNAANDFLQPYLAQLDTLRQDIAIAAALAEASDAPEFRPSVGSGVTQANRGFRWAVDSMALLPKARLRFNDEKLKEHLEEENQRIGALRPSDIDSDLWKKVVQALGVSSDALLAARDKLKSDYSPSTPSEIRVCKAITSGRNTIRLAIARRGKSGLRDVTDSNSANPLFEVVAQSENQRKIISVDPIVLALSSWNVPQFAIESDTLRGPTNNTLGARPGVMLTWNPVSWGEAKDWGFGVGLGMGLNASDVVSDFLFGGLLSYRDIARIGIGFGRSRQPESVKGATVGKPVPKNFGKIDDAIQNGKFAKDALYFIVALPGLSLKSK